jgi:hypothetical protein
VQNVQDIRAAEASKQINLEMQRLTEQGIKENKLMKRLTEQSTGDTRSMMAIALISAVFLPATFLAVSVAQYFRVKADPQQTLFGSNFFQYSQNDNILTVASNFWIYAIIATGFSGMTVLLWFVWRRRSLLRQNKDGEVGAP